MSERCERCDAEDCCEHCGLERPCRAHEKAGDRIPWETLAELDKKKRDEWWSAHLASLV